MVPIRVCNHFKYVTIQKVLYDETTVSKFMCFGGGTTNVEAEYVRDTFCVREDKLEQTMTQFQKTNKASNKTFGVIGEDVDP